MLLEFGLLLQPLPSLGELPRLLAGEHDGIAFLRPRLLSLAAGATLVAVGALLVEVFVQGALSPLYASAVVLVLVAPPVEELLKFLVSGTTGANFASAAGAGIGFAAAENALYFLASWNEPVALLATFVAVRALTDPLLHVTSTTLTNLTWHGRSWGLPSGLALHMLWNTAALVEAVADPAVGFLLIGVATAVLVGILVRVRRDREVRATLDNRWQMSPWTGALRTAGIT